MARAAKLRKKTVGNCTYWFTKAGGDTYLGKTEDVTRKQAERLFATHLVKIRSETSPRQGAVLTAGELMDVFLEWHKNHRADVNYKTRKNYCSRFGRFRVGTRKVRIADLAADQVCSADLEAFLQSLEEEGLDEQTRLHAETSVRHCWNWATKHPSPTPYLPSTFRPFSAVERTHVPLKPLTEGELMTDTEVKASLAAAGVEPNQFRRHGLTVTVKREGMKNLRRTEGQVNCFAGLLRCYLATGARTDELAACRVEDVLFGTRQVILGKHKRSRTQKQPRVRQVTLNNEALAVFTRQCNGKSPIDYVFENQEGLPWHARSLAKRFERVKEVAAALGLGTVRKEITIYDFRHLWISDMVAIEPNLAKVARMAGTSVAMIERVYGHFRNQDFHDSQDKLDAARKKRGL